MARRIVDLEKMPFGLSEIEDTKKVRDWYLYSFLDIVSNPRPVYILAIILQSSGSQRMQCNLLMFLNKFMTDIVPYYISHSFDMIDAFHLIKRHYHSQTPTRRTSPIKKERIQRDRTTGIHFG